MFLGLLVYYSIAGFFYTVFSNDPHEKVEWKTQLVIIHLVAYFVGYKICKWLREKPMDENVNKFLKKHKLRIKL